jgi:hypothetical protein
MTDDDMFRVRVLQIKCRLHKSLVLGERDLKESQSSSFARREEMTRKLFDQTKKTKTTSISWF